MRKKILALGLFMMALGVVACLMTACGSGASPTRAAATTPTPTPVPSGVYFNIANNNTGNTVNLVTVQSYLQPSNVYSSSCSISGNNSAVVYCDIPATADYLVYIYQTNGQYDEWALTLTLGQVYLSTIVKTTASVSATLNSSPCNTCNIQ
jgi:hypothetical protein